MRAEDDDGNREQDRGEHGEEDRTIGRRRPHDLERWPRLLNIPTVNDCDRILAGRMNGSQPQPSRFGAICLVVAKPIGTQSSKIGRLVGDDVVFTGREVIAMVEHARRESGAIERSPGWYALNRVVRRVWELEDQVRKRRMIGR